MDYSEARELAYAEVCKRLRERPISSFHNPCCMCEHPETCDNRSTGIEPTEYCVRPLKDLDLAIQELNRNQYKTALRKSLLQEKSGTPDTNEYIFFTLNPDSTKVSVADFLSKFVKFCCPKYFADYCGVIEQRGTKDKDLGTGYHCHILFKRITPLNEGNPPSNIKQKIKKSWANFCDTSKHHFCNIQPTPKGRNPERTGHLDRLEYMLGKKTKEGKAEKQEGDRLWRPTVGIEPFYGNPEL